MSDAAPEIALALGDDLEPVVMVGDEAAADMAALMALAPALAEPAQAAALALAVNHFAHGGDYAVIEDPAAFEADYLAKLAAEDPSAEWREGVLRLTDHGVPDFAQVTAPAWSGGRLVFHAVDTFMGLPYRVEAAGPTAAPEYEPLPLEPLPRAAVAGAPVDDPDDEPTEDPERETFDMSVTQYEDIPERR